MKLLKSITVFIIASIVAFLWIFRGYKMGKIENEISFKESYRGKIVKAYIPEGTKTFIMILSDSTERKPDFYGIQEYIKIGDSIKKLPNSFTFIIYKGGSRDDTLTYTGTNFYTK